MRLARGCKRELSGVRCGSLYPSWRSVLCMSKSDRVEHGLCDYLMGLVRQTEQVATDPRREGMAGKSQMLHQVARLKKGGTFLTRPAQTTPRWVSTAASRTAFLKERMQVNLGRRGRSRALGWWLPKKMAEEGSGLAKTHFSEREEGDDGRQATYTQHFQYYHNPNPFVIHPPCHR